MAAQTEATVKGTSMESFAEAADNAFREVPGDPKREGAAAAEVTRLWMTKGGIVGTTQYHAELTVIERASGS